jgi:hypothetical protein
MHGPHAWRPPADRARPQFLRVSLSAAFVQLAAGSVILNVVPSPRLLVKSIRPR